jgi:hypothetical protein
MPSKSALRAKRVAQLREMAAARGLSPEGTKATLIDALYTAPPSINLGTGPPSPERAEVLQAHMHVGRPACKPSTKSGPFDFSGHNYEQPIERGHSRARKSGSPLEPSC